MCQIDYCHSIWKSGNLMWTWKGPPWQCLLCICFHLVRCDCYALPDEMQFCGSVMSTVDIWLIFQNVLFRANMSLLLVGFVLCGSLEAVSDVFISWSQCNAVHCAALRELLNGVGATKLGFVWVLGCLFCYLWCCASRVYAVVVCLSIISRNCIETIGWIGLVLAMDASFHLSYTVF